MALNTPPTVKQGSSGDCVKRAQALLLSHGNDPGGIDGIFGPKTDAATKAFQGSHDSGPVDGIVGPLTWAALLDC